MKNKFLLIFTCFFVMLMLPSKSLKTINLNAQTTNNNIVIYDYESETTSFYFFEDSYWDAIETTVNTSLTNDSNDALDINSTSSRTQITDTTISPYKNVAFLQTPNGTATAFFIGKNLLLTAAHCVYSSNGFDSYATLYPARNGDIVPYGSISVKKIIIPKNFYDLCANYSDFDWAILIIEDEYTYGHFGKITNFSSSDYQLLIAGYPGDKPYATMWQSQGDIIRFIHNKIQFNHPISGGNSGGPVYILQNGIYYAVGIVTSSNSNDSSCVLIDNFIYRLTNSILANKGIEVRDHYVEEYTLLEGTDNYFFYNTIFYNCVVKYIVSPKENEVIYVSSNGTSFTQSFSSSTIRYYATGSATTVGQLEYNYFKVYNTSTQSFSSVYNIASLYSTDERSATYTTVDKTTSGNVIATSYDQSTNVWEHNGSSSQYIKGTIVYNGTARNIEFNIPILGYKYSDDITIDGVTFTLRCGPNKVSIKASSSVTCNSYLTMFAFGVG